jgi:hypothetical protein
MPEAVDDWRALNAPNSRGPSESEAPIVERYNASIRYQLDYILRFAADRSGESPLIILFGDHQPPILTPQEMGKQTPVHVLSRDQALIDAFLEQGFAGSLSLGFPPPRTIRHEGFLSVLMKGLHAAYGTEPGLDLRYREGGAALFENLGSARPG